MSDCNCDQGVRGTGTPQERFAVGQVGFGFPATEKGWFLKWLQNKAPNAIALYECEIADDQKYQFNYKEYLKFAYDNHHEIILTPDIIWFTLLCEVARIIDKNPDAYRDKFTTIPKGAGTGRDKNKTKIRIKPKDARTTAGFLDKIMESLKDYVPNGLAHKVLIEFTTKTQASKLAIHASFADVVKHYYEYWRGCQGAQGPTYVPPNGDIPQVHMEGITEDWQKVGDAWTALASVFTGPVWQDPARDCLLKWLDTTSACLGRLASNPDQNFLRQIYYEEGNLTTQWTTYHGWFLELLAPAELKSSENVEHVAQVPYIGEQPDGSTKDFTILAGVFSRRLEDNVLHPEFGHAIFEVSGPNPASDHPAQGWQG